MAVFSCSSCGFRFEAGEARKCPRCSSAEISEFSRRDERSPGGAAPGERSPSSFGPLHSGKEGWKDFHSRESKDCIECGGKEFDLNWKRKEKTCRKCGAVMPLPRRTA